MHLYDNPTFESDKEPAMLNRPTDSRIIVNSNFEGNKKKFTES